MAVPQPPELADVYDASTVAAIEARSAHPQRPGSGRPAVRSTTHPGRHSPRRHPIGAAGVAGSLWLGGLTGPGSDPGFPGAPAPAVAAPVRAPSADGPAVHVEFLWGAPRATRVVVRPWLVNGSG